MPKTRPPYPEQFRREGGRAGARRPVDPRRRREPGGVAADSQELGLMPNSALGPLSGIADYAESGA